MLTESSCSSPAPARAAHLGALGQTALAADHGGHAHDLVGRQLAGLREVVERAAQAAHHSLAAGGEAGAPGAALGGEERIEQRLEVFGGDQLTWTRRLGACGLPAARGGSRRTRLLSGGQRVVPFPGRMTEVRRAQVPSLNAPVYPLQGRRKLQLCAV